jgi:hypothetical protein
MAGCPARKSHSTCFYYRPRPERAEELELLERLDWIFTDDPVYGSRRLQVALLREGISVGWENAMRFPRLAHRSAAAHKLHSTPQQDSRNLIPGEGKTSSRLPAFSLFLPGSCPNTRDRRICAPCSGCC